MYLHSLQILNDGPIGELVVTFEVNDQSPTPTLFVGENGGGKTNVLSIIGDALFEGAALHHSDVTSNSGGFNRPWFRIVGGLTLRVGSEGGFAIAEFVDGEDKLHFIQKAGILPAGELERVPEFLKEKGLWATDTPAKEFSISEDVSRRIYAGGCYAYFPASRAEVPHWINEESLPDDPFPSTRRYTGNLSKPIYIERSLERLGRWIPSLLIDSRPVGQLQVVSVHQPDSPENPTPSVFFALQNADYLSAMASYTLLNQILQIILSDDGAIFHWSGRNQGLRVFSAKRGHLIPLSGLSSGQATLLSIFGTILEQCDRANSLDPAAVAGICVVDEVDAHIHIDLAYRAIPELVALFPKVQFILSAHSPLFVLGMKAKLGDSGLRLIEMPSGQTIQAEGFEEFGRAMEVMQQTSKFNELVSERLLADSGPLILCEGQTDPEYLRAAIELLGSSENMQNVTIDCVGRKEGASGSSVGSGKDNLSRVRTLLTDNPDLVRRPVLLLFDNDTRQVAETVGLVSVRSMPSNPENRIMKCGIENLLPEAVFTDDDLYSTTEKDEGNGKVVTIRLLKKTELCARMCGTDRNAGNFAAFTPTVAMIAEWVAMVSEPGTSGDVQP